MSEQIEDAARNATRSMLADVEQSKLAARQTRNRGRTPQQKYACIFAEHRLPSSLLRPSIAEHRYRLCLQSTVRTQKHVATGSPCSCSGVWDKQCSCTCAGMSRVQADRYPTGQASVDARMRTLPNLGAPAVPVNTMKYLNPSGGPKGDKRSTVLTARQRRLH